MANKPAFSLMKSIQKKSGITNGKTASSPPIFEAMQHALSILLLPGLFLLFSCQPNMDETTGKIQESLPDAHSFAVGSTARVSHEHLEMQIDFSAKTISGAATISFTNPEDEDSLFLDTRDLKILSVESEGLHQAIDYSLGKKVEFLGQALKISLQKIKPAEKIVIRYQTRPDAAAVQWLEPAQTAGKKHPMLFTQGQAILSRTWFPCQDSPGIRFTWSADVSVPDSSRVLMSAEKQSNSGKVFHFEMSKAVPAYLVALAAGNLGFQKLDENTGVYAEPEMLAATASEFEGMGKMLKAAEKLYGPYRWGRYDVLVLPPSFPFGGMENPCLTFATPSILAGDRSLVSLIAHELAHSWSGNLVTNETWDDFWLNEGFTVYFERRIMEELEGRDYADMLAVIGYGDLENTLSDLGNDSPDTRLKLDLKGRDADDGMTDIAYEKGYLFLCMLEKKVGRSKWDAFLKKYFEDHAFSGINTEKFLHYLDNNLLKYNNLTLNGLKVSDWVYGAGLPQKLEVPVSVRFARVEILADSSLKGSLPEDSSTSRWSSHEWLHYLRRMEGKISPDFCSKLDAKFRLNESRNAEIQFQWILMGLKAGYQPAEQACSAFLLQTGRRKFVLPLFRELLKTEKGKILASNTFEKAAPGYHSVTRSSIEAILKPKS